MRRFGPTVVTACVILSVLTACGGDPVKDGSQDVEFTPCSEIECSGTLPGGAEFEIILPEDWSGSLALFSHGLRGPGAPKSEVATTSASPIPISSPGPTETNKPEPGKSKSDKQEESKKESTGAESSTTATPNSAPSPTPPEPRPGGPEPAPLWGAGDKAIADVMLQAGYAVAGATPPQQGWSVGAQLLAADELYEYFVAKVAEPNRVYAWGESTGGLTSVRLAELHPDWVSGVVAMCAPMSGPNPSFNLALDVGFALKQLIYPGLKLVDYESAAEAEATYEKTAALVESMAASGPEGQAKILFIGALAALPTKTRTEPGRTLEGEVTASVEGILDLLGQTTMQRYEFEQLVGGNPSGNLGSDYRLRLTPEQRAAINGVAPGATAAMYLQMAQGRRIAPDPEALRNAAAQGELAGNLEVPVLTLHNANDPVYIARNESWYRARVDANGTEAAANLVDAYALPPTYYSAGDPAEEGAGHCNFDPRTIIGALIQLNDWVRNGQYPGRDSMAKAFKGARVTLDFSPGPWPAMALSPGDEPIAPTPTTVVRPSNTTSSTSEPSSSATPSTS